VYLEQTTPTTLDVITWHIILRVQEVLPFKLLLLEGWDGKMWKDHMCNCAPCHFPHVHGQVCLFWGIVLTKLCYILCG
jgi:hypothetical protein